RFDASYRWNGIGAHRQMDGAGRQRIAHAARPEHDFFHDIVFGEHRYDDVATFARVAHARSHLRASIAEDFGRLFDNVKDDNFVSCFQNAFGHSLAHAAQTYKTDFQWTRHS